MAIAVERRKQSGETAWEWIIGPLLILVGIACLTLFVLIPLGKRSDAAYAKHSAARLAAVHQLGFTKLTDADINTDGYDGLNSFVYPVGSCSVTVYIYRPAGQYKVYTTYITLKSVEDSTISVTDQSLQKLPQMASCFVK